MTPPKKTKKKKYLLKILIRDFLEKGKLLIELEEYHEQNADDPSRVEKDEKKDSEPYCYYDDDDYDYYD